MTPIKNGRNVTVVIIVTKPMIIEAIAALTPPINAKQESNAAIKKANAFIFSPTSPYNFMITLLINFINLNPNLTRV